MNSNTKVNNIWLLLCSLFFYGFWDYRYLALLLFSVIINYFISSKLNKSQPNRFAWMVTCVIFNLSLLVYYKYFAFLIFNLNEILSVFGGLSLPLPDIKLPIGISFFTFQAMSFCIDVYRDKKSERGKFTDVFLYIAFFPQLVAGPIVRAKELLPQIAKPNPPTVKQFKAGLVFIFLGLFQKCYIADLMGYFYVDNVYSSLESSDFIDRFVAFYAFPFQLFNDFSGYSNIAIGSALLFGFKIPDNFDSPFLSHNLAEFWSRWHISLSNWIRDYVFYPLIFSSWCKSKSNMATLITMALIGLWHGASWNFLIFGIIHGVISVFYTTFNKIWLKVQENLFLKILHWVFFIHLIFFTLVIFRIGSMSQLNDFFDVDVSKWSSMEFHLSAALIWLCAIGTHFFRAQAIRKFSDRLSSLSVFWYFPIITVVLLFVVYAFSIHAGHQAFIYFQF